MKVISNWGMRLLGRSMQVPPSFFSTLSKLI